MGPKDDGPRPYRPRNLAFITSLFVLLVVWFELARLGLVLLNRPLFSSIQFGEIASAFIVGLRFDVATACLLLAPIAVLVFLPGAPLDRSPRMRRVFLWVFGVLMALLTYLLIAEFEFFHEFQVRYNQIVITYMDQPATVGGMIWQGYPIVSYTLAWGAAVAAFVLAVRWLARAVYGTGTVRVASERRYVIAEIGCIILVVGGIVIGARGGVQSTPLRWGDAFKSEHDVVNQASLNGLYTLKRTLGDHFLRHDMSERWTARMSQQEARATARALLVGAGDQLVEPERSTMLRISRPTDRLVSLKPLAKRPNVVLVLMETFTAQFSAACGAAEGFTPNFDRLASEGILFDRCFSVGTHTHQGLFGTLMSFPNLPGYEALLQSSVSNQPFTTLPGVMEAEGYHTMFLYNGNLAWDNMRGFFKKHGMDQFISGDDFDDSVRRDSVWGVDDHELFRRANREFEAAAARGPFMGVILTLSNHAPWDLPSYDLSPMGGRGKLDGPINGVRYADWSIGRFIEEARRLSYFENTLFVFVGDHGSHVVREKLTPANLLVHHVPLLFYGPGVLDAPAQVDHTAVSQLNVMPTILGLLEVQRPHASWGRDVFTREGREKNVVIMKGSGGDQGMAIARGSNMLVMDAAGKTTLVEYELLPRAHVKPRVDEALRSQMNHELLAVLQSGIHDLRTMQAGPKLPSHAARAGSAPAVH